MTENLVDIALLLGMEYLNRNFKDLDDDKLSNWIRDSKSLFIDTIRASLRKLICIINPENLEKIVCFPRFILRSLHKDDLRGGRCSICCKYFVIIRDHLRGFHKLKPWQINKYSEIFGTNDFFFTPKIAIVQDPVLNSTSGKIIGKLPSERPGVVSDLKSGDSGVMKCPECGKAINEKNRRHINEHKRNVTVQCPSCGTSLKRINLKKHLTICPKRSN
jgi:endogenous inhibitor of DNA gyrase (YacG/DUF329 family)